MVFHQKDGPWSDEAVLLLRKLAGEGLSGDAMARCLHKQLGIKVTRNSVIGKMHRLGIAMRGISEASKQAVQAKSIKVRRRDPNPDRPHAPPRTPSLPPNSQRSLRARTSVVSTSMTWNSNTAGSWSANRAR